MKGWVQLLREELKIQECFPCRADPKLGHADNHLYDALMESVEYGRSLPVAGICHSGIVRSLSDMQGVSNSQKPLGMEIAYAEASILNTDGSLLNSKYCYLDDKCSEALIIAYLLDSSLCCVRNLSGNEALYTRSIFLLNAMAQSHGSFVLPDGYLSDNISNQINTGVLRAVRIDLSSGEFNLDTVSPITDTVVPQFLLQRFTKRFIEDLYETPSRIAYPDELGNVRYYAVALQEKYLRCKFHEGAEAYRRIAWDGKSPDVILPVYHSIPEQKGIKLFSMLEVRDIELFCF